MKTVDLRTPFELIRGNDHYYVLTRTELDKLLVPTSQVVDKNELASMLDDRRGPIRTSVILRDAPEELGALAAEKDVPASHNGSSIAVNIVIHCQGTPRHIPDFDPRTPTIVYSFDLLARYRSPLTWQGSGRPCPLCCLNLFETDASQSEKQLLSASKALASAGKSAARGVRTPTTLELAATLWEAVTLAAALERGDGYASTQASFAQRLDLTNGSVQFEQFPAHPQCSHEEYFGTP